MQNKDTSEMKRIPEITTKELRTAINKLKRQICRQQWNQSRGHQSLRRRDERNGETDLQRNRKANKFTPETWRKVRMKVIHKKRKVENVGNYRPISSLPALYKLFTTILYSASYPRLDKTQAEDQAVFRSSYQTTDHLATSRMIDQRCHECGIKMWAATIDFMKTFNSITHKLIWGTLKSCGIEHDHTLLPEKIVQRPECHSNDRRRK